MKKIFTFIFTACMLLVQQDIFAQVKTTGPDIERISEMLNGNWNWTESRFASRGVPPTLKTPQTEKQNVSLNFRPGNQVAVYVNRKLNGIYQYTLSQQGNDYVMIRFKANEGQRVPEFLQEGPVTISDNELTIAGGYNDAGQNVKFRKAGTTPASQAPTQKPAEAPKTQKAQTETQTRTSVKMKTAPDQKVKVETKTSK